MVGGIQEVNNMTFLIKDRANIILLSDIWRKVRFNLPSLC